MAKKLPKEKNEKYANTPKGWQERWAVEFGQSKEFHRKWKAAGKVAVGQYLGKDMKTSDTEVTGYNLNLFASNINTMLSMLYGRVPQVSVDRRYADPEDQVARVASEMATRILNADIEEAGEDFSSILRACLQDRLIPGLGAARVRYDIEEGPGKSTDDDSPDQGLGGPVKKSEWVEDVYVPWNDIQWSPARFWSELRWMAFRLYKDKDEVRKLLSGEPKDKLEEIIKKIPFNSKSPLENATKETSEVWDKCEIWEIWDKTHKKVSWYVDGHTSILKTIDDPLELEGFFPAPPFFIANVTTMEYLPKNDFSFASSLYREINRLEERIALLTMAIKVIGVYDKKAGADVGRLINETAENKLIPVDAWAAFSERGGIKGSIEFLDVKSVAEVLEILQTQQDRRISQLFQINGMSDIIRGQQQGDGRVSATADQLKAKFASIRIQSIQDEFTRFATDMQKKRFEVMCKHFDAETLIARSNMENTADKDLCPAAAQFLKDSEMAKWRIIIQPESMAMTDYSQLRQERTEYINSLGIFLQSSFPIAEKFPGAAPVLMELLKWGLAGFKGSKQIEGVVDRAMAAMEQDAKQAAGQPPPPDPQVQKIQLEMKQDQENHQAKLNQMQVDSQQKTQQANQEHTLKMQEMFMEFQAKMKELDANLKQIQAQVSAHVVKAQADQSTAQVEGQTAHVKADAESKAVTAKAQAEIQAAEAAAQARPLGMGPAK